jgi:excisionase family DNA binding protein
MSVQKQCRPFAVEKPVWVSVKDATRLSGIGRTKLYELLNANAIASVKIRRKRLVSLASIEALGSEAA